MINSRYWHSVAAKINQPELNANEMAGIEKQQEAAKLAASKMQFQLASSFSLSGLYCANDIRSTVDSLNSLLQLSILTSKPVNDLKAKLDRYIVHVARTADDSKLYNLLSCSILDYCRIFFDPKRVDLLTMAVKLSFGDDLLKLELRAELQVQNTYLHELKYSNTNFNRITSKWLSCYSLESLERFLLVWKYHLLRFTLLFQYILTVDTVEKAVIDFLTLNTNFECVRLDIELWKLYSYYSDYISTLPNFLMIMEKFKQDIMKSVVNESDDSEIISEVEKRLSFLSTYQSKT